MKVFMNTGRNGSYYVTTFYHKDQQGNETKRNVYVAYAKGLEPMGNADYDLVAIDKNTGKEYGVILDCFTKQNSVEPKLFLFDKAKSNNKAWANEIKQQSQENQENSGTLYTAEQQDLPFY